MVSWIFPDFKLQWLVEETKRNLPCELNFVMEGQNAEKTAGLMKHLPWLHVIPKEFILNSNFKNLFFEHFRFQKFIGIFPLHGSSPWNSVMA